MNDFEVGRPKERTGSQEYTFDIYEFFEQSHADNIMTFINDLIDEKRTEIIYEEMARMGFTKDFIYKNFKDFKHYKYFGATNELFLYKDRQVLEIFWDFQWSDEKCLRENRRCLKVSFKTKTYGWGKE